MQLLLLMQLTIVIEAKFRGNFKRFQGVDKLTINILHIIGCFVKNIHVSLQERIFLILIDLSDRLLLMLKVHIFILVVP